MPYNLPNPFLPKQSNKDQPLFISQKPVLQQSRAEPILPKKESLWQNAKDSITSTAKKVLDARNRFSEKVSPYIAPQESDITDLERFNKTGVGITRYGDVVMRNKEGNLVGVDALGGAGVMKNVAKEGLDRVGRQMLKTIKNTKPADVSKKLLNEAKKYKTLDNFIDALNINFRDSWRGEKNKEADRILALFDGKVFHGTNAADEIINSGYKKGNYFNSGAYFADTPDTAINYMKQNRSRGYNSSSVLLNDLSNLKIKQGEGDIVRKISKVEPGMEEFVAKLKRQGYDGVKNEYGETLVWNTQKIKTPEKLEELWRKSQAGFTTPDKKINVKSAGAEHKGGQKYYSGRNGDMATAENTGMYGNGAYLTSDVKRAKLYGDTIDEFSVEGLKLYEPKDTIKELFGRDTNYGDSALITKKYKELGYDGLKIGGGKDKEIVVFDPKKLNKQLTTPKQSILPKAGRISQEVSEQDIKSLDSTIVKTPTETPQIKPSEIKPKTDVKPEPPIKPQEARSEPITKKTDILPSKEKVVKSEQLKQEASKYKIHDDGYIEFVDDDMQRFSEKVDNLSYIKEANKENINEVVRLFNSSKGRKYNEAMFDSLKKSYPENFNTDGTITLYRGGDIKDGLNSFSISKNDAEGYANWSYGSGKQATGKLNEIKVKPEDVEAIINGEEFIVSSKAHKVKPLLPKPKTPVKEALEQEAKKYKTAEEFIKAQPTVYHGTGADFKEFDITKSGSVAQSDWGNGIYFTNKKEVAKSFANDAVGEAGGKPRIMEATLDLKNPAKNKDLIDPDIQRVVDDMMGFEDMGDVLKKKGFDGIEYTHADGSIEYVVFDTSKIKTKSQLTDIWNKAHNNLPGFSTHKTIAGGLGLIGGSLALANALGIKPQNKIESESSQIEPSEQIISKPINKIVNITDDQRNKVIATIIGEGIGEGEAGMQAILNNIISRAEKGYRGSNLFEVVSSGNGAQYNAFSVNDPNYKQTLDYLRGQRDATPKIKEATEFIKSLLEKYDKGELEDLIGGNMNYLNPSITSERGKELSGFNKRDKSKDIVIGNHVFWSN